MGTLSVERMLEEAQAGKKFETVDRRRMISYIQATRVMSNRDMAELFKVSEGQVRKDIKTIRIAIAKEVQEDDVALVVGDIIENFKRQMRDLEASKAKAKLGTKEYLAHCVSLMEMELRKTKTLQDLGYLPKNLGNMTVENFEYTAVVLKGDQIDTRPTNMFDDGVREQLRLKAAQKALPSPPPSPSEVVDAEYIDAPREISYAPTTAGRELPSDERSAAQEGTEASKTDSAGSAPQTV